MSSEKSYALGVIRSATQNFDSVAQWMQRWAAWGMYPDKFSQPSIDPPEYQSDKDRILKKLESWRDEELLKAKAEKDPENESSWDSYIEGIERAIRFVKSA